MCECSQSHLKTVSKLTFDSKMTKSEIERPQMEEVFLWLARTDFLGTPNLFEHRLRGPLADALD